MPKSRLEYWKPKITRNRERDTQTRRRLRGMRWRALVLWECQLHNLNTVTKRIRTFLKMRGIKLSILQRSYDA
jgi:DNA mismatch endonuclease (patch repair protein)